MNLAIVGSRSFINFSALPKSKAQDIMRNMVRDGKYSTIVSGGAIGVDSWAKEVAEQFSLSKLIYYPNWNKYGKGAGFIRNEEIIDASDYVLIFWDGSSKGTKHDISLVEKKNKAYELYIWNEDKGMWDFERNANN